MDWIKRLNRAATGPMSLPIDHGAVAIEVLHWAYSPALPDNVPHRHTFYEACLVGDYGCGTFTVQNIPKLIQPGDLFLARPGVIHQIQNTGSLMELCWVSFLLSPSGPETAWETTKFAESPEVLVVPNQVHGLIPLWNVALRDIAGNEHLSCPTVSALGSAILLGILHAGTAPYASVSRPALPAASSSERLAQVAVRYIHDNLNRPLSVNEIAGQIHVSPRHLTRLLEKFTGVSPASYIERARIDRAATMLLRSDMPIKTIADEVGYATVHHFTRTFSRVQGKPPGQFRIEGGMPIPRNASSEPDGSLV